MRAAAFSPTLAAGDVADCAPINDSTSRGDLAALTCGNGVCSISGAGSDGGENGTHVSGDVDPCATWTWAAGCKSVAGGGDGEGRGDRVVKSLRLHWMLASDSLQLQRERMAKVVPWQGAVVILLVTALQAIPL